MTAVFNSAIFNNAVFNTDDAPNVIIKQGTGGIDQGGGQRRVPFKPTGLIDRPRKEGRKDVEDRAEESAQIAAEIAAKLAREFGEETQSIAALRERQVADLSSAERDLEIGVLLRKKIKTDEDELMLLLMIAAAAA